MRITPGKYRTRGGDTAVITQVYASSPLQYPVRGSIGDMESAWMLDGRWHARCQNQEHDLVERIPEPTPEMLEDAKRQLETTVRFLLSEGIVPTITQYSVAPLAMGRYQTVVSVRAAL